MERVPLEEERPWPSRLWAFGPPAVALALALAVFALGANEPLFRWVNGLSRFTGDAAWAWATLFGDALVAFVLVLPLVRRYPEAVWALMPANLLVTFGVHLLKRLVDSPRPLRVLLPASFHVIGPALKAHSFPSGHTATAFVFAGVFVLTLRNTPVRLLLLGAAALVGVSRIVVGVHWPLDVLAGAALGWLSAVGGLWIARCTPRASSRQAQLLWGALLAVAALVLLVGYRTEYAQALILQRAVALASFAVGLRELRLLLRSGREAR